MTTLEEVRLDIGAFADSDEEVIVDTSGRLLFVRGGREITAKIEQLESGRRVVHIDDQTLRYRKFLTHYLARLDVFADRLVGLRSSIEAYVDTPARLDRASDDTETGTAAGLLEMECTTRNPFAARVVFVTADAGHGKTALLREYQLSQARRFREGSSDFVFWHVDLQGRQLLRLSEALMGDLADLRVVGLWMPGVIRLMRAGALVLAIDGFDELAAEQGSTDALGALARLIRDLGDSGTIVAASRRTFFDADTYLRRTGLLRTAVTSPCEFDVISLQPWQRQHATDFFARLTGGPGDDYYEDALRALGGDRDHPMLTRPFLAHQLAQATTTLGIGPSEFIREMDEPSKGVESLVRAFVNREVAEKWQHRETGEPYLSADQHMDLLAAVAEEMFLSQKDRLPVETVEALGAILLDDWGISPPLRPAVVQMLRMHALLNRPSASEANTRSFDHEEIRDFFIAHALRNSLEELGRREATGVPRLMGAGVLSNATARYVASILRLDSKGRLSLVEHLCILVKREMKPTHLQTNVGTIIPYLIDGLEVEEGIEIDGPIIFSSLALEGTELSKCVLRGSTFVNVSLVGVRWTDVRLEGANLGVLSIDKTAMFSGVSLSQCRIDGLRLLEDGEEQRREYAPDRIRRELDLLGVSVEAAGQAIQSGGDSWPESTAHSLTRRLLRTFHRSTYVTSGWIETRFGRDSSFVLERIMPLLEANGLLRRGLWRGQGRQDIWFLSIPLEELLGADSAKGRGPAHQFWAEIRELGG